MFSITIQGDTLLEMNQRLLAAAAMLAAMLGGTGEDKSISGTATRTKPAAEEEEPAPRKKPAAKDELDYEADVRPVVVQLSKDFGREAALEVLGKFTNEATDEPCTKGQEVSEKDWAKLLKEIKKYRDAQDA